MEELESSLPDKPEEIGGQNGSIGWFEFQIDSADSFVGLAINRTRYYCNHPLMCVLNSR